jgi:predicted ATP-grasp superfamily ATP-dependent carboligase
VLRRFLQKVALRFPQGLVLFACTDTAVVTLAQIQDTLPRHYVAVVPRHDIAETMVSKTRFYQSLQHWNVPHPFTLSTDEDINITRNRVHTFPVYLRPSKREPFEAAFGRKGFIARTPHELQHYLRLANAHNLPMMIQDIIPGPTRNGYVFKGLFDRSGRLVMSYTQRKLRQPSMFANSPIHVSIQPPPNSSLARFQHRIIDYFMKIQYTGLFGAEFKLDSRDGLLKLLEVNARTMGDSYIGIEYGMNDVLAAYRDALGNDVAPIHAYTPGIWFVAELEYLQMLITRALKRGISRRDLLPYFQHKFWFIMSRDDPSPFIMYLLNYLSIPLRREKFTLPHATRLEIN